MAHKFINPTAAIEDSEKLKGKNKGRAPAQICIEQVPSFVNPALSLGLFYVVSGLIFSVKQECY